MFVVSMNASEYEWRRTHPAVAVLRQGKQGAVNWMIISVPDRHHTFLPLWLLCTFPLAHLECCTTCCLSRSDMYRKLTIA